MRKKWFLWRALGTLVFLGMLAGLLTVSGMAIYRTGWSQGYVTSQVAVEGEEGEIVPAAPPYAPYGFGYPRRHYGYRSFFFGAGLIKIGLFFLMLVMIGKAFRWATWGRMMAGGPWRMGPHHRGKWGRRGYGHRHHGPPPHHSPVPPWCWDWDSSEEQTDETPADPDVESDTVKE
ncbi:MAG: hypothetical protein GY832_06795 [Chloroflexi bacterium]|nr:hypothetical protein [Chloroflexota bacterium]